MRVNPVRTTGSLVRPRFRRWRRAAVLVLVAGIACPALAQPIQLVSVADSSSGRPAGGGGDSVAPVLSSDGRYVLFSSTANNLALTTSNTPFRTAYPPRLNVFLRDPSKTALVSLNAAGTGGGNGDSIATDLSKYGRQAVFESSASDLVAGDTNNCSDVFWRDIVAGTTRLVSVGTTGAAANGVSRESVMTSDGRYVAFVSEASNLVPGDTNGIADVFVMDMQSSAMTLVSVGAMPTNPAVASCGSSAPDITPDGRYVVFCSAATNLVPGVQSVGDIYVRDLVAGTTYWASVDARAALAAVLGAANTNNAIICHPRISEDGRYVVFRASPGITSSMATIGLILRYNPGTGLTEIVHTNANVVAATAADEMRSLDMTPDGEFIAFVANTNSARGTTYIGVWDALTGETVLASGDLGSAPEYGAMVCWPTIDPTGRFVAFLSPVTNRLAPFLLPGRPYHLYVRDLQAGTTKVVDTNTNGVACGVSSTALSRLSAGGQYIAFEAPDGNLVPGDSNHAKDVFLCDLVTGTTRLVSARAPSQPSLSPSGSTVGWPLSTSADGRYVAFTSEADNLVASDTNKCQDVFVRDLAAGVNYLVSARTNTWTPGEGCSIEPSISADGRYAAFTSYATNLIAGDNNQMRDVFVRDLLTGATTLVSGTTNRTGPGNGDSHTPAISADGRRVLFYSTAKDLAPGPYASQSENLFYRDLQSGATRALTGYGVRSAAMTPDGRWVAFVGALSGPMTNLYLWDSLSASRVYTNTTSGLALVSISSDGSRLAYATASQLSATDWKTRTTWSVGAISALLPRGYDFQCRRPFPDLRQPPCTVAGGYEQHLRRLPLRPGNEHQASRQSEP